MVNSGDPGSWLSKLTECR